MTNRVGDNTLEHLEAWVHECLSSDASPKEIYLKNAKVDWKSPIGKLTLGLQGMNVFNEIYSDFPDIKNIAVVVNHTSSLVSIDEENKPTHSNCCQGCKTILI